jgi:hypothetical protein
MTPPPGAHSPRCSELSRLAHEPLHGSAPENAGWLLVEQAPPWGRDALLESGVDRGVAAELARRAEVAGLKVLLIRRPGTRPQPPRPRRAFAVWTGPGGFVQSLELADDAGLLALDLGQLARGERLARGEETAARLLLVCTNGRRDACCALHGRRAADALAAVRPDELWECSHLGGHRFAATMLSLPSGACFGRLGPASAVRAANALDLGVLDLRHLRGIAGRPAPVQVAEAHLRERHQLAGLGDVSPVWLRQDRDEAEVQLRTRDGLKHTVRLERLEEPPRRVSCAAEPETGIRWVAAPVEALV